MDEASASPAFTTDKKKLNKKLASYTASPESLLGIMAKFSQMDEKLKLSKLAEFLATQIDRFTQEEICNTCN